MKPQIVSYGGGVNNTDLAKSASKLYKGGSWKKQRKYNKEQQRAWYLKNSEKKKLYAREYYALHRESRIEVAKKYREKNPKVTLASRLRCSYGITVEDYEFLLKKQGSRCAICNINFDNSKRLTKVNVDHCHKSNVVRGLLCSKCNISLGHLEKQGFLENAVKYLGL